MEFTVSSIVFSIFFVAVSAQTCSIGHDRGHLCDEHSPHLAYHYDKATGTCLAYKHLGCGGNDNKFLTESECYAACVPADRATCAFGAEVYTPKDDQHTIECRRRLGRYHNLCNQACPETHYALYGMTYVGCCSKDVGNLYEKNVNPQCDFGQFKRIGRSCSDDFCDEGYECVQNEVFATCCPVAPKL